MTRRDPSEDRPLLSNAYQNLFEKLLRHVAVLMPQRKLTCFWPQVGSTFERGRGCLFVGQAVNGWGNADSTWMSDRDVPEISAVRSESEGEASECPMSWLEDSEVRSSPFWSTVRWLASSDDQEWEEGWSRGIAWSNLFKLAPQEGGNPDPCLRAVQFAHCRQLLEMEIQELRPSQVVVLTGMDWFQGFFPLSKVDLASLRRDSTRVLAAFSHDARIVLSPHPAHAFRQQVNLRLLARRIERCLQSEG
jgi:hypothetical protein